jgi:hypothetical protein
MRPSTAEQGWRGYCILCDMQRSFNLKASLDMFMRDGASVTVRNLACQINATPT